jgi:hypothetical protein
MPDPIWPSRPSEILLWVQIVSIAMMGSYSFPPGTGLHSTNRQSNWWLSVCVMTLATGIAAWFLPAPGTSLTARLLLTALMMTFVGGTILARPSLLRSKAGRRWSAEWEIGTAALVTLGSATIIGFAVIGSPASGAFARSGKMAAILSVGAAFILNVRAGTLIVRGILRKTDAVPHVVDTTAGANGQTRINTAEFNRGRSIGNIERLLMVIVVSVGSYEALAFLVAAKGLIRAKEFEDRDFAEYFILGSLASVAVALVLGLILRVTVLYLWKLPV